MRAGTGGLRQTPPYDLGAADSKSAHHANPSRDHGWGCSGFGVLDVEVAERERHRAEGAAFLSRRLHQLATEREKLLRAYYADAIDVATLKREQARITAEVADAESQLATDGEKLAQAKQIIDLALDLAKDCATSYRKGKPEVRKMWNRAFFNTIRVQDGAVAAFTYEEPFASLLGSHKGSMVVPTGFEPVSPP